jgi:hypothetical protein
MFACRFHFHSLDHLGQLASPDYSTFSPPETAFSEIARVVGGKWLSYLVISLVVGQAVVAGLTVPSSLMFPLIGFIVSTSIWLSISSLAFKIGFIWSVLGLLYLGCLTHGFRQDLREPRPAFREESPVTSKA